MRVLRLRALAALTAIAGYAAMQAGAAEPGFYVGFLYGDASKDLDTGQFSSLTSSLYQNVLEFSPDQRAFSTQGDGESYGFLAGYRLTQHIAFEGGFVYLGKQSYRETSSGFFFPANADPIAEDWAVSLTSRTSGFSLSALGILPLSYAWEAYARAGVLVGQNRLSVHATNGNLALADRFNESSTDWLAGVGISMSLAEVYAIRAEYQRIFDAGDPLFGEADADLITIGVTVSF